LCRRPLDLGAYGTLGLILLVFCIAGALPFILTDIIPMALLVAFPMVALWLPMTMVAAK
jgi:hypothetical protein